MQEALFDQQDRLLQAFNAKRWSQVDEIWLEVNEEEPKPLPFHQPIIDKLLRMQQHPERLVQLYQPHIDSLLEKGEGQLALSIIEYILSHDEKQEWLRIPLMRATRAAYEPSVGDRINDLIERAGLQDENVGLRKGLRKLEDMLGAAIGQVFAHSSWGLGVVKEMDVQSGKVIIDFALKKNQVMTLDGVRGFLKRIPKDHIQAQMALAPDELKQQTKKQPGEVIRLALRSYNGRIKVADLKKVLTNRFLDENEYKNFWNNARKAIKLDPMIDQVGTGVHGELVLRSQPRSFFDAIFSELLTAKDPGARREVLRDVRRHGSDAEMTDEDTEALYQLFLKPLQDNILTTEEEKLNHGLLFLEFSDLFEGKENPVDVETLLRSNRVMDLLRTICVHESRRIALEKLIGLYPETWAEMFAEVTVAMDSRTVAWMEKELASRDKEYYRHEALENILAKPGENPDLFVWAAKNILEGNWNHLDDSIRPILICEELLSVLSELEEDFENTDKDKAAQAKNHATKVRGVLNEGNSKHFKKAVAQATVEEARKILQQVRLHNALSHQLKQQLEGIVINEHEELRKVSRMEEEEEKKKPAYHYTTRAALDEKRQALSKLISEDIPGMSKVIETAREHGDLRENSEYHAAKERQKLLMQQAAELEDLIARARVVEDKEVMGDTSRFGTKITLKDLAEGSIREISLMGMWEADVANNIISYLTPLGSQLLGRRVGEQFQVINVDGSTSLYEVMDIQLVLQGAGESH